MLLSPDGVNLGVEFGGDLRRMGGTCQRASGDKCLDVKCRGTAADPLG